MITSNIQLGFLLTRGGGQAVQGGLSCPPPRISKRMDNQQFLLHHLLQKYLVERDINFISVNLRCLLQTFSCVMYWQEVGASCPGQFILPPPRNQHSMAFQTPIANTDVYKGSFFPQTIRDWNALPDSLISSAEDAEDCVAKFTSLVRAMD